MKLLLGNLMLLLVLCLVQCVSAATVRFNINLTWENYTVAGVTRPMILTNGQFPGPELRLNEGDDVEFSVWNFCPFSLTVHFHGIEQNGTPWSDGVPGLTQRSIDPDRNFVYRWKATQYGAYWYHAHHRGHLDDGLYGPIYIAPASSQERPFNSITTNSTELQAILEAEKNTSPVILSDWKILTSEQVWAAEEASGVDAYCANALLVNGKGSIHCFSRAEINKLTTPVQHFLLKNETLTDIACLPPDDRIVQQNYPHNYSAIPPTLFSGCTPTEAPHEVIKVDPAKQYVSWDLTSSAGVLALTFSVDEHQMYVYAIDGWYIEPMLVDAVTIPNANRYSVLVPLDQPAGNYTIRVASASANQILNTTATMSYEARPVLDRPSKPWITVTSHRARPNTVFLNESQVVPFPVIVPSSTVDATHILHIERYHSSYRWTLSNANASFNLQLEESNPLLFDRSAIPKDLTISTKNNTWVDLIIEVIGPGQPQHPIHKHSNKHFIIGQGFGPFNYSSVAEAMQHIPNSFNFQTPQYRDTSFTPGGASWLAIRYQVVNPGPFLMHCHIQLHLSGGMALAIMDGVDAWPDNNIPLYYRLEAGYL